MRFRILLWLFCIVASAPVYAGQGLLVAITWHDIVERRHYDPYAVTVEQFREQLSFLQKNGYHPVTLQQCIRMWQGQESLPPKAVLLTFDDGLDSYRKHALPLLREYGFPSVLSVVTAWVDGQNVPLEYRGKLMGWDSLKKVVREGRTEVVSHSHNLHHGVRANPQGNQAPAAVTHRYLGAKRGYEADTEFRQRVLADLQRSQQRLKAELGFVTPALTWPYGAWNSTVARVAGEAGMPVQLTLDPAPTRAADLPRIHRRTFYRYRSLAQLEEMLDARPRAPIRFIAFELDRLGTLPASRREQALSLLVERLGLLRATGLVIDPFTADGRAAYFPQQALPVKADLLGHVLHQVASRNSIQALYVHIPAAVPAGKVVALATALARISRVFGVILASNVSPSTWQQTLYAARRERPDIPVGIAQRLEKADAETALLVEIDPQLVEGDLQKAMRALERMSPSALFMVGNTADTPKEQLIDQLAHLRRLGVRNFGYAYDALERDVPPALDIVGEFKGHSRGKE